MTIAEQADSQVDNRLPLLVLTVVFGLGLFSAAQYQEKMLQATALLAIGGVLLLLSVTEQIRHVPRFWLWLSGAWMGTSLLSMTTYGFLSTGVTALALQGAALSLFLGTAAWVRSTQNPRPILYLIVGLTVLELFVAITGYTTLSRISETRATDLITRGTFGWHNTFSGFLLLTFPVVLSLILITKRLWLRYSLWGVLGVAAATMYFSTSRGSWLISIVTMAVLVVLFKQQLFKEWKGIILVVVVAVLISTLLPAPSRMSHSKGERAAPFTTQLTQKSDVTLYARPLLYRTAIRAWQDQPVFGHGLGQMRSLNAHYMKNQTDELFSSYTHNYYLQTLAEAGLTGFAVLVTWSLSLGVMGFRAIQTSEGERKVWLVCLSAAIAASTLHSLIDFDWHNPYLFGLLAVEIGVLVGLFSSSRASSSSTSIWSGVVLLSTITCLTAGSGSLGNWYFEQGKGELKQGAYEEAARSFGLAKLLLLDDPRVTSWHANALVKLNLSQDAMRILETSIDLYPYEAELPLTLAMLHLKSANVNGAQAYWKKSIERQPAYRLVPYYYLGRLALEQKDDQKTLQIWRKGLKLVATINIRKDKALGAEMAKFVLASSTDLTEADEFRKKLRTIENL